MSDNGWIKLHRKIQEWEWYGEPNVRAVFIHLLLIANHKSNKWNGITIQTGQIVTSIDSLFYGLNRNPVTGKLAKKNERVTVQNIRTSLKKLKSTGEITIETTNQYSVITINNYCNYQQDNKQTNKQLTNNQQTTNKQLTTNKNDKNEKNDKKREEEALEVLQYYNEVTGKNATSTREWINNFSFWRESYSLEVIKTAIKSASVHGWIWKDRDGKQIDWDLQLLFRQKDRNQEPQNYIERLLNRKSVNSSLNPL